VVWSPDDNQQQMRRASSSKAENGRRAVVYARMSTEHQRYSVENQSDVMEQYAAKHGMTIVRHYVDSGKSGLKIQGREGLARLIQDVQAGDRSFDSILVYDVSRWGRFQDVDEAAHYEHICRQAGYTLHYCAEQFTNDGSPISSIVKGVKRAMAGEYSRELSNKVFIGQCRLIQLGYRQGGPAGYGLRRMLLDERGNPKTELQRGEHKSLQTDRVVLVPGPAHEVATIRRIYQMFVEAGRSEAEIAAQLNDEGIRTDLDRPWTRGTINQILTNEKYIGNNVFNRTSFKLKQQRVRNAPEDWVRAEGAFHAIVDAAAFHTVQGIIRERSRRLTDDDMLQRLKRLYDRYGFLSGLIIDEAEETPPSSAYSYRFGSLLRAYQLIGFTPDRDYRYIEINRRLRQYHRDVTAKVLAKIEAIGAEVSMMPDTELLRINDEFTASLVIARHMTTPHTGRSRWKIRFETSLKPDITIGVRMDQENERALDYYLLPRLDFFRPALPLADVNNLLFDSYRFDNLDYLFDMADRAHIKRVA
jgi:DNA invertase Pin-like site-specific DNA recombinase